MDRRIFILSILPLAACSRGNQTPEDQKKPDAWKATAANIEKQAPALLELFKVPGLSIALVENARMVWRRGFGVKDRESKIPVDTDTIFEAASMSKPVFAYAVMKLCEKGVLNLDTPLTKYTPERIVSDDPRLDLITAMASVDKKRGFAAMTNGDSGDEVLQKLMVEVLNPFLAG